MTHQAPVRRISRLLAALGLAVGLLATAAPAALASPATKSSVGWLRLAHLSPNTPAVDVYLYSLNNSDAKIVLHHVSYGTVSPYQTVAAGEYTVAMRAAGSPASKPPVLSTAVDITAGHAYTVAGMGPNSALRLQVLDDTLTTPPGRSLVRVIQASLQQHKVTVTWGTQTLASNLAFASVTSYVSVAPGSLTVHVKGESESATSTVDLAADTTHTLVVLDDPGHLSIDNLTDAAGSKLMPEGAAATGFGGMAPRPAGSPLPWALAMGAGMILVVGGGLGLRRFRPRHRRASATGGAHAR
jgi:Domain of unknown function (DUF4397)